MRVERVLLQLDHSHGKIGTVVGDTLKVRDQIVKDEAVLQRADPLLKAVDMPMLQLIAEIVDEFLRKGIFTRRRSITNIS